MTGNALSVVWFACALGMAHSVKRRAEKRAVWIIDMCKGGGDALFNSLDVHRMGAVTNETCRASEEGPIGNGGKLHDNPL